MARVKVCLSLACIFCCKGEEKSQGGQAVKLKWTKTQVRLKDSHDVDLDLGLKLLLVMNWSCPFVCAWVKKIRPQ